MGVGLGLHSLSLFKGRGGGGAGGTGVFLGCLLGLCLGYLPTFCTKDAFFLCWGRGVAEGLHLPLVSGTTCTVLSGI